MKKYSVHLILFSISLLSSAFVMAQKFQLVVAVEFQEISCAGSNDAYIDLSPSGGTAPYTFQWSTGETTSMIDNLPAGTYTADVTDAGNTVVGVTVTITEPTPIDITSQITHVSTYGGSDGSIDLTLTGGTGTLDVLWNNSSNSEDLSGLTADYYTVTITDENGCTASETYQVFQPEQYINGPGVVVITDHIFTGSIGSPEPSLIGLVYPNPSNGSVDFIVNNEKIDLVRIYNNDGLMVRELPADELNTESFGTGEYYIHYTNNNQIVKKDKFIIR